MNAVDISLIVLFIVVAIAIVFRSPGGCCGVETFLPVQRHSKIQLLRNANNDHDCEFHPECLWDISRWVTMKDGRSGVCNLHGVACATPFS